MRRLAVLAPVLLVLPLALTACGPAARKSPCAGLTYTDAGVSREQYGPCARAMVGELDRMHEALRILGDAARPKDERLKAKTACLNANTALVRLIGEAGGTDKLVHMSWADPDLTRFNSELVSARDAYLMYCYYGLAGPDVVALDRSHAAANDVAQTLP